MSQDPLFIKKILDGYLLLGLLQSFKERYFFFLFDAFFKIGLQNYKLIFNVQDFLLKFSINFSCTFKLRCPALFLVDYLQSDEKNFKMRVQRYSFSYYNLIFFLFSSSPHVHPD
jgi:hypothetical protein